MTERGWHSYIGKDVTPEMRSNIYSVAARELRTALSTLSGM